MNGNPFLTLSDASLTALAVSLREGALSKGLSRRVIEQITGSEAAAVANYLENLARTGMKFEHMAHMADAILQTRRQSGDPVVMYDLVLSGPEVEGVPTADTAAVVQTLISEAKEEILLVGYAIHNGKKLFEPLMARMRDDSSTHHYKPN